MRAASVVLYVFSILLTSSDEEKKTPLRNRRVVAGLAASVAGAVLCIFLLVTHSFGPSQFAGGEIDMHTIGHAMMGTGNTSICCLSRRSACCCWLVSSEVC